MYADYRDCIGWYFVGQDGCVILKCMSISSISLPMLSVINLEVDI